MLREYIADESVEHSPPRPCTRAQLLTVAQLLEGKAIDMPPWRGLRTFKKAPKSKAKATDQGRLGFDAE